MTGQRIRKLALAFVVLTAGCTASEPAPDAAATQEASAPVPVTQQELDAVLQQFTTAIHAGDGAAAASIYASDAVLVSAGGKTDGQPAIAELWIAGTKAGRGKELTLETLKWGSSGDLGYSFVRYTGGVTAPSGHSLSVVQRQADGTFKTILQISIPDPAK